METENVVKVELIGELKDGREVYEVCAPLDAQILALKDKGINAPYLATPEEIVLIRLEKIRADERIPIREKIPKLSIIGYIPVKVRDTDHTFITSYAPVKVRGKPTIVTSNSPWLFNEAMTKFAMEAFHHGRYPSMPKYFYEILEDIAKKQISLAPEDRTVHIIEGKPKTNEIDKIDCGKITLTSEMDDTKFLFKKFTREYIERFHVRSISFYDLIANIPKDETTINYLLFRERSSEYGDNSIFYTMGMNPYVDNCAYGLLDKRIRGTSQNSGYATTDVRDSIRESIPVLCHHTGLTGIEKIITSPAEKIILRNLRKRIK